MSYACAATPIVHVGVFNITKSRSTAAEGRSDYRPTWEDAPHARSVATAVLADLLDAPKYLWIGRSLHIEKSGRALLQSAQAVIDEYRRVYKSAVLEF